MDVPGCAIMFTILGLFGLAVYGVWIENWWLAWGAGIPGWALLEAFEANERIRNNFVDDW